MQEQGAEDVAAVIRTGWRTHPPTDGFRLTGARALPDAVEVAFRWRLDPQPYRIRFPHPGFADEVLGPGSSAEDAATEMSFWLMEELDTGFVARARRTGVGDAVLLEPRLSTHSGWFVGDVPLSSSPATARRAAEIAAATGERFVVLPAVDDVREPIEDPGRFLDEQGLDGTRGRRAVRDGDLIAWLQVDRGDLGDGAAGQAVVVRDGPASAVVLHLEVTDSSAFAPLAAAACRCAVEAGAERIAAPADLRGLLALGFQDEDGRLVARYDRIRMPADL